MPDKMRIGRVCIDLGYVVDMDNEEMVQHARDLLLEDLMAMFKGGQDEVDANIREDEDCIGAYDETDIPDCLLPERDEEDEEELTRRDEKNGLYGDKIDIAN
jgi:hypothetical protein